MDQDKKTELRQLVSNQLGLYFHDNQWSSLERYLSNMARELKIPNDFETLRNFLSKTSYTDYEFEALSKNLTIGETYFFREKTALQLFSDEILPRLIRERRNNEQHIRVWSAGCSTGEEPYTLAMIVRDLLPDLDKWKIEILATDINLDALRKARAGSYPAWSFRETTEAMKKKYFAANGKHHDISKEVKQMVTFSKLNLANDSFPSSTNNTGNFDVIFCRNVLMYLLPSTAKKAATGFHQSLKDGGWLVTSQVELNDDYFSMFSRKMYEQGIFYQKTTQAEGPKHPHSSSSKVTETLLTQHSSTTVSKARQVRKTTKLPGSFTTDINSRKRDHNTNDKAKAVAANREKKQPQEAPSLIPNTMHAAKLYAEARYSECAACCEQYIKQHPFDKQMVFLLIQSLANTGKLKDAREWSEQVLSDNEVSVEILYLYATILMEQNDWEGAESALIKTLYLDPAHPSANFYLANTMKKTGKTKLALKYYNHLLHLLSDLDDNETVPAMDGMTAGRLRHMVEITTTE
jgi:chemotaxis protein methyltransferase CheR